jgi:hypothetical protein
MWIIVGWVSDEMLKLKSTGVILKKKKSGTLQQGKCSYIPFQYIVCFQ